MKIYLMRHGKTAMDNAKRSDGWLDLPLSDKGRIGLIPAQQRLKLEKLHAIHSAPLRRTEETAHIIASGMIREPVTRTHKSAGTWDMGVLAGVQKDVAHPQVKELLEKPDKRPIGGETFNEFKTRYLSWFRRLVKGDKDILIVCSGSNLRLLGGELFGDRKAFNLSEGGLVELTHEDGSWHFHVHFDDGVAEGEVS